MEIIENWRVVDEYGIFPANSTVEITLDNGYLKMTREDAVALRDTLLAQGVQVVVRTRKVVYNLPSYRATKGPQHL